MAARSLFADAMRTLRSMKVVDSFQNIMSGVGTARAKNTYGSYARNALLSNDDLETLWQDNDLAATIVSKIVEDSLRAGFRLEREGEQNPEADEKAALAILKRWAELGLTETLFNGACWGRLFGEGGLILGVKGAGALDTPLDDAKATGLEFVREYDRQDLTPVKWDGNGEPTVFRWAPQSPSGMMQRPPLDIHETRLVRFHGVTTTVRGRARNMGWHHSVLQRVYNALMSFDQMFASCDAMFSDASQAVFKLRGLISGIADASGEGEQNATTRLQLLDMMRSAARAIMLDAGGPGGEGEESFEVVERGTLGSIDGVMDKYYVRLAASARMPLTVLLGMAPAGQDATGESDLILWYNTCDVYRQIQLAPHVMRMVTFIARDVGDKNPESWKLCWPELQRPTPMDARTAEKMAVDSAVALLNAQVLVPEEVALSLTGLSREGISALRIDTPSRLKRLKDALKELEDGELGVEEMPEDGQVVPTKTSARKTPSKAQGRQAK